MKVKVVRTFRDKYTKELYKAGAIIEIAQQRFEEINSTAAGVLVQEIKEEKSGKATKRAIKK